MVCGICGNENLREELYCDDCGNIMQMENKHLKFFWNRQAKIFYSLALFLLISGTTAFNITKNIYSPENVVKTYLSALLESDYDTAYIYLANLKSPFLTKDHFISTMREEERLRGKFIIAKIANRQDSNSKTSQNMDQVPQGQINNNSLKKYQIKLERTLNSKKEQNQLTLVPEGKFLGLFIKWKIQPRVEILTLNLLTKGVAVKIDEINQEAPIKIGGAIPLTVFEGQHDIAINAPWAIPTEVSEDELYQELALEPSDDLRRELTRTIEEAAKAWTKSSSALNFTLYENYLKKNTELYKQELADILERKNKKAPYIGKFKELKITDIKMLDQATAILKDTETYMERGSLNQVYNEYKLERINGKWLIVYNKYL
jgi:hypothetical protein